MVNDVGLGSESFTVAIYMPNRPPLDQYQHIGGLTPLVHGEIAEIARLTGNHWRKIFNVYAKLAFKLCAEGYGSWQQLRDDSLLQPGSNYALLFSAPSFAENTIHIIAGKQHAHTLGVTESVVWVDRYFAVNRAKRLIVSPYLDYRQLSDARIDVLAALVNDVHGAKQ